MSALDREGNRVAFTTRDLSARVIQHEHDHIDGMLFIDRMRDCRSWPSSVKLREPVRRSSNIACEAPCDFGCVIRALYFFSGVSSCVNTCVARCGSQLFFDPKQAVVFGDALGARQ